MSTKTILRKRIFLIASLTLLLCFNAGDASMLTIWNGPSAINTDDIIAGNKEEAQKLPYVPGEVLVKFKEGTNPQTVLQNADIQSDNIERIHSIEPAAEKFRKDYKIEKDSGGWYWYLGKQYKEMPVVSDEEAFEEAYKEMPEEERGLYRSYKVKLPEGISVEDAISKLKDNPDIEYAEPNGIVTIQMVPNDPYYLSSGSWGQAYDDLWGLKKIQCQSAWDLSQGEGVVVAVIDTGVDYTHPDISSNIYKDSQSNIVGYDFANGDSDPMDDHGHGTHCAGTIAAAGNNGKGIIGVAPRAKIMPVKGLNQYGSGAEATLADCVKYAADNGAKVLSNSWGGPGTSQTLTDAFHYADNKGCICIAAAGNSNIDALGFTPANIDTVITVGASNQNDAKCDFSNYGYKVDVAAPGGDSAGGDGTNVLGRNILSLRAGSTDMYGDAKCIVGGTYYRSRGTSMACPHVAGEVALVLSRNMVLSRSQVRSILQNSVDPVTSQQYIGTGRINVKKAADMAINPPPAAVLNTRGTVSGITSITGTAKGNNYQGYSLYIGTGANPSSWEEIYSDAAQIDNGELCVFNFTSVDDGDCVLKLVVRDTLGRATMDMTSASVNNIQLLSPLDKDYINGIIEIKGSIDAYGDPFIDYNMAYSYIDDPANWIYAGMVPLPYGDVLGFWNTTEAEEGDLTLKITATYQSGNISSDSMHLILDKSMLPGWPQQTEGAIVSSPAVGDIDGDGLREVVIGSSDGKIYVWHYNGVPVDGWPLDTNGSISSSPVIADIDGDGVKEIIIISKIPQDETWKSLIYALHPDGTIMWTREVPAITYSSPSVADINADGKLEIFVNNWNYCGTQVWNYDGSPTGINFYTGNYSESTVAIVDVNKDGRPEVIGAGSEPTPDPNDSDYSGVVYVYDANPDTLYPTPLPGWPQQIAATEFSGSPAIGDIDGDGGLEIIVAGYSSSDNNIGKVYAWHSNGTSVLGWPIELPSGALFSSPTLADIDSDGKAEAVVSCWKGEICVFRGDGSIMPGWPKAIDTRDVMGGASPSIADIDLDGKKEIVISGISQTYVYDYQGILLEGWPKKIGEFTAGGMYSDFPFPSCPAIADINGDNKLEIIVGSLTNNKVYVRTLPYYSAKAEPWPMFRHDPQRTGYYGIMGGTFDITVISPNGGEMWKGTHPVMWDPGPGTGTCNITCSINGGTTYPITVASGVPNSGAYSWNTSSVSSSTTCRIKVYASSGGSSDTDISDSNFTIDNTPPAGSVVINNGDVITATQNVTLTLSATDAVSGMGAGSQMQFSNDGTTWSTAEAYAVTKAWTLTSGDGTKTVYARFKDAAGNWSIAYSDTITLNGGDTTPPTGSIVINSGDAIASMRDVTLTLSATDTGSGMGTGAQMMFSSDGSTWSAAEAYATSKIYTLTSGDGTKTVYVKFSDAVGNWSTAYSDNITLDTTPPTGSIAIDSGAATTTTVNVTLALSAADAGSGMGTGAEMMFSNDNAAWSAAEAYATSKSWTLTSGDGLKTVYVKFKDVIGNWSTPYSDTITLTTPDATPPTGSIIINNNATTTNSADVALALSATDAGSGMGAGAEMMFSNDNVTWLAAEAYETARAWTLPLGNGIKTVYVKFKDVAGNWSEVYSDTIMLDVADTTPPTGSVVINSGVAVTINPDVTLYLSATDEAGGSGMGTGAQMQFSNDGSTWSTPESYAATKSWTLSSGDGSKTVYVKFKDVAGNWSNAVNDTITLEATPPTGTIVISNGDATTPTENVTLTLSATDAGSGMGSGAQMRFSNDNVTWSAAESYAVTKSWALTAGDGLKTVYVKFKDVVGNWSIAYSDTITLVIPDSTPPTGSIVINSGLETTSTTSVTLTLSATDNIGGSGMGTGAEMQFSNDNVAWSAAEAYTTSKAWVLTSVDGVKTVYVKFKDVAGNWSTAYSDTITLDTSDHTPPTGTIVINSGAAITTTVNVALILSASDAGSGMGTGAQMMFSNDNVTWSTAEAYTTTKSWTLTAGDGVKTVYVKFKDVAGNWSGAVSDSITLDITAPAGTIVINAGDTNTTTTNVTLALSAADAGSGMGAGAQMKFSGDNVTWSAAEAYATSKAYTLPSGDGTKTVYVKFKDVAGNWSSATSDSIVLDVTSPTGSVVINGGAATTSTTSVTLALSATDNIGGSGMGSGAEMKFSNDNITWSAAEAYAASKAWVLASADGTKTVYVKFKDVAGNWSTAYSDTITLDTADHTPPVGTIVINSGATVTSTANVTLTLSATDEAGGSGMGTGAQMMFSNDNVTWSAAVAYATSKAYTLPSGDGTKTVYAKFKDAAGNWSSVVSDSITLDATMPTGTITINSGAATTTTVNVTLALSAADAGSGMGAGAEMKFSNDNVTWSAAEAYAASKAWVLASVDGTKTVYVKFKDVAGNWSASISDTITLDTACPTGTISINSGAATTTSADVTLTLSATDAGSGMGTGAQMMFSNDNVTWSAAEAYATAKSWILSSGDGTKTVYVKFKDVTGNWSGAISDTISLDTACPTGTIVINSGVTTTTTASVTLTLSATDAGSGMGTGAEMKFSNDNVTWSTAEPYATTKSWTLSAGNGVKTVYVKFKNVAGNWSGAINDTILLDTVSPTGTISINSGAATTTTVNVTLTLSAADSGSGMGTGAQMMFSNDNVTWSAVEAYAATKAYTLPSGDGTKTVYVKFKDAAGNWSAAISDTIALETTPPTGTISINSGAATATSVDVTLTLSATDAGSGMGTGAQMRFSNDNVTWSAAEAYTATKAYTLPSGDGTKTVYVKFKDVAGNWSTAYSDTITLDTSDHTPPSGTIVISSGAAITTTVNVTLALSATDAASGMGAGSQMMFSNDNVTWSAAEAYATTKAYTLTSGDGTKTVYVKFKDVAGNWSSTINDTIVLDTTPPSGSLVINDGAVATVTPSVTLTLSATDAGSGMGTGSQMMFSNDNVNWSAAEAYAATKTWILSPGDGTKTVYGKFKDAAGNWSNAISSSIILEATPPTGTISINSGAITADTPNVTLTLSATDTGSGMGAGALMMFSDDGSTWSAPEPYKTNKEFKLSHGNNTKTINVKFKDVAGNWSMPYPASIMLNAPVPNAPSDLTASVKYGKTTAQVNLAWKSNSKNETGFRIERKIDVTGVYATLTTVGPGVKKWSDVAIVPDTTYYYRVCAYNDMDESSYSNEASVVPLLNAPIDLTIDVKYAKNGSAEVNLKWKDNSKSETGFIVERKLEADGTYAPLTTLNANVKKHVDGAITPDTTYYYKVCAIYSDTVNTSYSGYTNEASITPILNAPTDLIATVKTKKGATAVDLKWKDNSKNEKGFIIERKVDEAGPYALLITVEAGTKKYSDSAITADTTYFYRVCAHGDSVDSSYSNEASVTPVLNAPLDLSADVKYTKTGGAQVNLKWKDNSKSKASVIVERKVEEAGTYAPLTTVVAGTKKYTDSTVTPDVTYYYRVYTHTDVADSPYSNEVSVTPLLNAPHDLTADVKYAKTGTQVNLKWKDNSKCETGFRIERKTEAGGTYAEIATVIKNTKKYTDDTVAPETAYYYRVCAYSDLVNSSYSNEAAAAPALNSPSDLTADVKYKKGVTQATLKWSDNSKCETEFRVERKTGAEGTYAEIATVIKNTKKYTDDTVVPETVYYYRICARSNQLDSDYSNEAVAAPVLNAPVDLTATVKTKKGVTTVDLKWKDNSKNEKGFVVERKEGLTGTYAQIATPGPNVKKYTETPTKKATTYYYRVYAQNEAVNSDYSNETGATIP